MDKILIVLLAILFLPLILKVLKVSSKIIWKVLVNSISGVILLFLFNLFGAGLGLTLELNFVNILVAGLLGLPGIILLLIIK